MKRQQKNQFLMAPIRRLPIFVIGGLLLLLLASPAKAVTGDYNKAVSGTLAASEWNNLINDFVAKSGARLDGLFSINTATSSSYALDINGALRATSLTGTFSGTMSAGNISSGAFGLNTGGGNYSFPGNVGIGTTSPIYPLDIISSNASLLRASRSGIGTLRIEANSGLIIGNDVTHSVNGKLQFVSNGDFANPQVTISSGGNVGVGTTAPSSPLTVTASTTGIVGRFSQQATWNNSNYALYVDDGDYTYLSGFRIETPGGLRSLFAPGGQAIGFATAGDSAITFTQSTSVERMRIASGGNVGIATSAPASTLDVNGLIKMRSSTITANEDVINKGYLDSALASTTAGIITQVSTSSLWQGSLAGNIYNANSGNVGIGTTNPASRLEVSGSTYNQPYLRFSVASDTTRYSQIKLDGAYNQGFIIDVDPLANSTYDAFSINLSSSTAFHIDRFRNIGIGTTSPATKLDVVGGIRANGLVQSLQPGGNYMFTMDATHGAGPRLQLGTQASPAAYFEIGAWGSINNFDSKSRDLKLYNNGGFIYMPYTTGNVGIGTSTPGTKLTVIGSGNYSIDAGNYRIGNVAAPVMANDAVTKSYMDSAIGAATSSITLWGGSTAGNIWSLNSGNVGVGTTNPAAQLAIDGTSDQVQLQVKGNATQTSPYFKIVNNTGASVYTVDRYGSIAMTGMLSGPGGAFFFTGAGFNSTINISSSTNGGLIIRGAAGQSANMQEWRDASGNPLTVINGSGYLGIGTSTPSSKLYVNGTSIFNDIATFTQPVVVGTPVNPSHAATRSYVDSLLTGGTSNGSFSTITVSGTSTFATAGGNVGIGTTNPVSILDVNSPGASGMRWFRAGSQLGFMDLSSNNLGFTATNDLILGAGGVSQGIVLKKTSGNVGIGTSSPLYKLHIESGDGVTSGEHYLAVLRRDGSGGGFVMGYDADGASVTAGFIRGSGSFDTRIGTSNQPNGLYIKNTNGNVGIGTTTPGSRLTVAGSGNYSIDAGNYRIGNVAAPVAGQDAVTKSYMDSAIGAATSSITLWGGSTAGNIWSLASGNVGIGTTNPTTQLEVKNTTANYPSITLNTNQYGGVVGTKKNGGTFGMLYLSPEGGEIRSYTAATDVFLTGYNASSSQTFKISSNGVSFFNGGNVGIGTTTPTAKLYVNGTSIFNDIATFTQPVVVGTPVNPSHAATRSYVDSLLTGGASSGSFSTLTVSGTSTLATASGNVGIGTTNPIYKLHVAGPSMMISNGSGSSNASLYLTGWNAGVSSLATIYSNFTGGLVFSSATGESTRFQDGTDENMVISGTGNVGIGTTNPTSPLYVFSALAAPLTVQRDAASANVSIEFKNNSASWFAGQSTNGNFAINTSASLAGASFNINTSGNVGIGTTTPGTRLTVIGSGNYSIDAGNYRVGNLAAPVAGQDAVTKSYMDSAISAATSSITLWGGSTSGNIWSLNSGNVGVGTSTPLTKMHIYGNSPVLSIEDTGQAAGATIQFRNQYSGSTYIGSISSSYLDKGMVFTSPRDINQGGFRFKSYAGSEVFVINTLSGNVGIGSVFNSTNTPSARLAVVGSGAFGSSYATTSAPTNGLIVEGNVGIGTTNPTNKLTVTGNAGANATPLVVNTTGTWLSGQGTGIQFKDSLGEVGHIQISYDGTYTNMNFGGLYSGGYGTSTSQLLTIRGNGNVGVGTTTPGTKLTIVGTGNYSIDAGNYRVGNLAAPVAGQDAVTKNYLDSAISAATSSITLWGGTTSGNIWNLNSGNVGIGVTNPGEALDVNGNIRILATNHLSLGGYLTVQAPTTAGGSWRRGFIGSNLYWNETAGNWQSNSAGGGDVAGISFNNQGTVSIIARNGYTQPRTFTTVEVDAMANMTFLTNGNVGIGITNPAAALDIYGTSSRQVRIYSTGATTTATAKFMNNTMNYEVGIFSDNTFGINYGAARSMTVNTSGNVGINTTNPTAKLYVNGTSIFNDIATFTQPVVVGAPVNPTHAATKNYVDSTIANATSSITLWGGSTTGHIWSLNSGNVGIGTTTPAAKLELQGNNNSSLLLTNTAPLGAGVGSSIIFRSNWATGQSGVNVASIFGAKEVANDGNANGYLSFSTFGPLPSNGLNERMRISSAGYVGIGVTNPGANLHVSGTSGDVLRVEGSGTSTWINFREAGANRGYLGYGDSGHLFTGAATDSLSLRAQGSLHLGGGGNNLQMTLDGTNVGIGSTTPQDKLVVAGGNVHIADAAITSGTPKAAITKEYLDSSLSAFNDTTNLWKLNGSNLYASSTTWNVGIGTTNPGNKLTIYNGPLGDDVLPALGSNGGKMSILNGATPSYGLLTGVLGTGQAFLQAQRIDGTATAYSILLNPNGGNVGIATTNPGAKFDVNGSFRTNNSVTFSMLAGTGNRVTAIDASGVLGATSMYSNGGSIGIGISNPSQKLHVYGGDLLVSGISDTARVRLSTSGGTTTRDWMFFASSGDGSFGVFDITASARRMAIYTDGSIGMGTNSTQFFINSSGNVGIGTTDPGAYRLNVNGNTNITGSLNVTGTTTATAFVGPVVGTMNAANVSSGAFGANTGGGNYSFPGNVGIGTSTAPERLTIAGGPDAISLRTGGLSSKFILGTSWNASASDFFYLKNSTSADPQFLLTLSGSVGIGTTAPAEKFHVSGGHAQINNTSSAYYKASTASTSVWFGVSTTGNGFIGTMGAQGLDFRTNNTQRIMIDANGNVGIGTTDPGAYRLKVSGDVAITGSLQTQTGSDFAEEFAVSEDLIPGTVVVMDDKGHKSVKPCSKEYDKTVVGIVSDNPSIIAGKVDSEKKVIVAMVGVVSVNVSSDNGRIEKGDMLTTSDISGYAVKASQYVPGTIIGKALEDLSGRKGRIKVLVNLQ